MPQSYTTTTRTSFGARMGNSCKGMCCGPVAMLIAIVLLFWNEGRAVARYKDLEESSKLVINVDDITSVNADYDGDLVHMSGDALPSNELEDSTFGVTTDGLKLRRNVKMYQWVEHQSSSEKKNTGGSSTTQTTYTYDKEWKTSLVSSNNFHVQGHTNPSSMSFSAQILTANSIYFGSHTLPSSITSKLNFFSPVESISIDDIPQDGSADGAQMDSDGFYYGNNPSIPEVGDTAVSFDYVPAGTISILAVQDGNSFKAYTTSRGGTVLLVQQGVVSAQEMLAKAEADNVMVTWMIRAFGFLLMFSGLSSFLKPISTFADVFPLLGNFLEAGLTSLACSVSAVLSFVIIAVAWLVYRPFMAIGLLSAAAAVSYFLYTGAKRRQVQNTETYGIVDTTGQELT